jgi:hypothetical protein
VPAEAAQLGGSLQDHLMRLTQTVNAARPQ